MQFDTVLERTDAGVGEIHKKSNRLTQSERLVLIMTDGRTDVATLIEKLPSLSMPRVFRAIAKLQDIGLVSQQIVAPVGTGNANDAIAPDVVERFLEQTDLDPATIIRPNPEEFSPTTLPPGMSLKDPTAPVRDDTELERRLKELMGETPKFARPDAPPKIAPVPAAAAPSTAPVVAAPTPVPPPVVDVAPEDVVRAARQAATASAAPTVAPARAMNPRATTGIKPQREEPFDVPMPARSQQVPMPGKNRTQQVPPQPPKQSNGALYVLMLIGAALVVFALLRALVK